MLRGFEREEYWPVYLLIDPGSRRSVRVSEVDDGLVARAEECLAAFESVQRELEAIYKNPVRNQPFEPPRISGEGTAANGPMPLELEENA